MQSNSPYRNLPYRAIPMLVIVVLSSVLAACTQEAPKPEPIRPVLSRVVAPSADPRITAAYSAEVRARYENDLAFRIGGKVIARLVEVGSVVKKGQVLARLDPADARLQAEGASAQLASAEADITWARAELERYRSLRATNFVSAAVLDQKKQAFEAAEARVRQMRAQLAVSQNQSSYATLVAEYDGVITAVSIEPGQVVTAAQPAMRVARTGEKEVLVNVPESRLGELRAATGLAVTLWNDPTKRYAGRVREVAPNADPVSRTFAVKVSILAPDDAIKLGMTANLLLGGGNSAPAIVVPLTAIGDDNGKPVVWVVDTDALVVAPRPVNVGAYREDGAVVTDGLAGGERIVVAGVQKLLAGQKVRLASELEQQSFIGAGSPRASAAPPALVIRN